MKSEVFIQSSTRIDFAGGTLDCWPINVLLSPVVTINGAIDLYTSCRLKQREDKKIMIQSLDTNIDYEFKNLEELLNCHREDFAFFREMIAYWKPEYGFCLSTKSESPVGGGLGASSSLCVSIFRAFCKLNSLCYEDNDVVQICSGVEAKILNKPTGTQDYFPPLKGGLNIIEYQWGRPRAKHWPVEKFDINGNISLFFTGRAHHSGINNWQVIKKFVEGDKATRKALGRIKEISERAREVFLGHQWESLSELFTEEFQARMELSESFLSPEIETLSQVALKNGGEAVKICGAGGGGCVFVWSQPKNRDRVIQACVQAGFRHLDVKLV